MVREVRWASRPSAGEAALPRLAYDGPREVPKAPASISSRAATAIEDTLITRAEVAAPAVRASGMVS